MPKFWNCKQKITDFSELNLKQEIPSKQIFYLWSMDKLDAGVRGR
jgi:hypothetical protein